MGSGRRSGILGSCCKAGQVLFEIAGVPEETAREALRLAANKLPIKCKFVKKENIEEGGEQVEG